MPNPLFELPVLVFDCQASGPNPAKGFLMEMSWKTHFGDTDNGSEKSRTRSYLVKPATKVVIPWPVRRLTGITPAELNGGIEEQIIWNRLLESACMVKRRSELECCPTVIHYSRFEEPYLAYLHQTYSLDIDYPFDILCTHQMARRLWPELPRRGLRALAGFLGHSVDELRRSPHHVNATLWIWDKIKAELAESLDITELDDLRSWLAETPVKKKARTVYPIAKEKRMRVPSKPGVYQMLRSNGDILYIGKAGSLKRRVNSYFQKQSGHSERMLEMLSQATDLDYVLTPTALEASLLETDRIKEHSPPYNKALKTGNREIVFGNSRLSEYSSQTSSAFQFGPLPSADHLSSLTGLARLLESPQEPMSETAIATALGLPKSIIPEIDCFKKGVQLFAKSRLNSRRNENAVPSLIKVGMRLHWEKLASKPDAEIDLDEEPAAWTAESVESHLESCLRRSTLLIRRAVWFCRLSQSVIVWENRGENSSRRNVLTVKNADVHYSGEITGSELHPYPKDFHTRLSQRKKQFDIPRYDRMSVLTTELKRLVRDKRAVRIRFGPRVEADQTKLVRILLWV